jgi:hypothetical protein
MRRRYSRCHLHNDPAAEISYSEAGLIKFSRVRPLHNDDHFTNRLPEIAATETPPQGLLSNALFDHSTVRVSDASLSMDGTGTLHDTDI